MRRGPQRKFIQLSFRDFGGQREAIDMDAADTASRECSEETLGMLTGCTSADAAAVQLSSKALGGLLRDSKQSLCVVHPLKQARPGALAVLCLACHPLSAKGRHEQQHTVLATAVCLALPNSSPAPMCAGHLPHVCKPCGVYGPTHVCAGVAAERSQVTADAWQPGKDSVCMVCSTTPHACMRVGVQHCANEFVAA